MLHLALKAHRDSLQAGTSDPQKLFVLLKVIPDAETARSRPPLALALVVDTSGSMRDKTDAGTAGGPGGGTARSTKLDHAIKAAQTLVNDERLLRKIRSPLYSLTTRPAPSCHFHRWVTAKRPSARCVTW
jgi:Ca-activated chloride channel family protein